MTGFDFPDKEAVQDIRSYADLNRFNETLEMMGTEWLDDSVDRVKQQSAVLRNVSIILLGIVFMWIASGIFSLQQQIANSL
jgi:type II secretory pathway component PulF